ncbi:MAG: hypothetical protein OXC80_05035, partial [Gammaproteobacteria bacterium]|nr:hypothetical protein [Gammaproteobacteria bacterium]
MKKLSSIQMASFAANGFVRLDKVVPQELNQRFIEAFRRGRTEERANEKEEVPAVPPGTAVLDAFQEGSVLGEILRLPAVQGAIESLVG